MTGAATKTCEAPGNGKAGVAGWHIGDVGGAERAEGGL